MIKFEADNLCFKTLCQLCDTECIEIVFKVWLSHLEKVQCGSGLRFLANQSWNRLLSAVLQNHRRSQGSLKLSSILGLA